MLQYIIISDIACYYIQLHQILHVAYTKLYNFIKYNKLL